MKIFLLFLTFVLANSDTEKRKRMLGCVNLAQIVVDEQLEEIDSKARSLNLPEDQMSNKIVADLLQKCYLTLTPAAQDEINQMGEDLKTTASLEPWTQIPWEDYKEKGDIEVTEEQKQMIQSFMMLAYQADNDAESVAASQQKDGSEQKSYTGSNKRNVSTWEVLQYIFDPQNFNMMILAFFELTFAVIFGSLVHLYEIFRQRSKPSKEKTN